MISLLLSDDGDTFFMHVYYDEFSNEFLMWITKNRIFFIHESARYVNRLISNFSLKVPII